MFSCASCRRTFATGPGGTGWRILISPGPISVSLPVGPVSIFRHVLVWRRGNFNYPQLSDNIPWAAEIQYLVELPEWNVIPMVETVDEIVLGLTVLHNTEVERVGRVDVLLHPDGAGL